MSFAIGQKIIHPEHGEAIVHFVGENHVGLEFPGGQQALFKKEDLDRPPINCNEADSEDASLLPWPQSTFEMEGEGECFEHYPGSHWSPFADDVAEIMKRLPELLKKASEKTTLGLLLKPERELPEDWEKGVVLAWPSAQNGIAMAIRITPVQNELIGIFPFIQHGSQHSLTVEKVRIWEDGLTAQIEALWCNVPLTFFDIDFVTNRGWYESGHVQEFLLTGFAYNAQPSEIFELPITHDADFVAWQNQLAEEKDTEIVQKTETLRLKGMAMLLPLSDGDSDEYSFRGETIAVERFTDFLEQDGWFVRVRVIKETSDNLDLNICITEKVWEGKTPPQIGNDIEGSIWLQGHLWSTKPICNEEE